MITNKAIRTILGWALASLLIITCQLQPVRTMLTLPTQVNLINGNSHNIPIIFPNIINFGLQNSNIVKVSTLNESAESSSGITLEPVATGSVQLQLKLLGIIPIQTLNINVLPELKLITCGQAIGVYMQTDGLIVTGFMKLNSADGSYSPAERAGMKTGDYLKEINGRKISTVNQLEEIINEEAISSPFLNVLICQGTVEKNITIKAIKSSIDNKYKIGVYGKSNTSGIGTLTFIDPDSRTFGALGHTVTDPENHTVLDLDSGTITLASITSIQPAKPGLPGQKNGISIDRDNIIGNINKNGNYGIYGNVIVSDFNDDKMYPVALSNSIQEGAATILTVVDGEKIEEFDIEIVKVNRNYGSDSKGMVIEIVDDELLKISGGIVQGMSGSPIIQNNCIIGAVTHVFLNNPKRGYGCYIENMVYESELLELQLRQITTNIWSKRRTG